MCLKSSFRTTAKASLRRRQKWKANGNGLENMRRRAEAIGGAVKLPNSPGNGTRIEFTVLLPEQKADS